MLRADDCALILIDAQKAALQMVSSISHRDLVKNMAALTKVALVLRLPILMARAPFPHAGADLIPEFAAIRREPVIVEHTDNDAWPSISDSLATQGRSTLILAGISTDVGVCLAALSARAAGHPVFVAVDACGTLSVRAEQAAWMRLAQAGVALASWTAIAAELSGSYLSEPGLSVLTVVRDNFSNDQE